MNNIELYSKKIFESIKHTNKYNAEHWSARELSKVLEYKDYRNFLIAIYKAMGACRNSNQEISDHFGEATAMVDIGSGAKRKFDDYHLSRYACYLVVQNADSAKKVVALGQTYIDKLADRGYVGKVGQAIGKNSLNAILKNERYIRVYTWNKKQNKYMDKWAGGKPNPNIVRK